jgi:Zn-finger nucleic acid-binding protein
LRTIERDGLNLAPVQGYHVPGRSDGLSGSSVSQDEARKKVNVKSFLDDFIRGASEDELQQKHSLDHSEVTRVVGVLKERGEITPQTISQREEGLRIRFGRAGAPRDSVVEGKAHVDVDTGLVLHCPSCGASVRRGASTCQYCEAHLDFSLKGKTIHCPHCFAATPADSRFCILCARPMERGEEEGAILENRLCPRCEVSMRGVRIGDFSVAKCSQCGGFFVPNETFDKMQEKSDRVIFPTGGEQRGKVEQESVVRYVRCPVCLNMMNRTNFARISGVIIDSCRKHGIWFDPDEMEKIMDFIARGGLQKAKAVDIDRLKDEEKLVRLRSTQPGNDTTALSTSFEDYSHSKGSVHVLDLVRWVLGASKD